MNSIAILLIGTLIGLVIGVSAPVLVYLRSVHDQRGDAELLDAVQENGWHLGYINGNFAVLGGAPQRVIGEPGDDVREVLHRALELLELGVAPMSTKEPKNG